MKLKKWIFIAILLTIFYYAFIVNFFVTLSIIASLFVVFRLYKFYARRKLNKLSASKELFRQSHLGHFIALVAKVAKADGRVDELEAQLIGMMFDDISKLFDEKDKTRAIMKEIFNEEKEKIDDVKEIAKSLNNLLGRSILKRRQFISFLIQLAFIDKGISSDEEKVLLEIAKELNISPEVYDAIVKNFENKMKNNQQTMSASEAYKILGVKEDDDMNTVKKTYRKLIREYHPDIISSQEKDESYIEEATAKTQEINQAYQVIKDLKK
ncbi:DnaJ domain-containing protein [Arcobacter sp. LA11]|uniref:DnaJ domain-containing protein n=1 Tax=Arcobacter sp. LA11 TaxID=1898176 RepID=UPI0009321FF2|nr:DnaJ domain-containing protein [Arcobacter sp. LA11]